MNVLVGCEFSGVVREAFRARGHNAWSCDLLPADDASPYHIEGDLRFAVRHLPGQKDVRWDLLIAHPPCTYLCNSGVRWLYQGGKGTEIDPVRWRALQSACAFFQWLLECEYSHLRLCIENPVMHKHARARIRRPDQIVHPWQFGHGEIKATALWLRGLPYLKPTEIVMERKPRVHHESPGPDRWKRRSITYQGIAKAMAEQWG